MLKAKELLDCLATMSSATQATILTLLQEAQTKQARLLKRDSGEPEPTVPLPVVAPQLGLSFFGEDHEFILGLDRTCSKVLLPHHPQSFKSQWIDYGPPGTLTVQSVHLMRRRAPDTIGATILEGNQIVAVVGLNNSPDSAKCLWRRNGQLEEVCRIRNGGVVFTDPSPAGRDFLKTTA